MICVKNFGKQVNHDPAPTTRLGFGRGFGLGFGLGFGRGFGLGFGLGFIMIGKQEELRQQAGEP